MNVFQLSNTLWKITLSLYDDPDANTVNIVACLGRDGVLLVDAGWEQTAERMNAKLQTLNDGPVKLIIVTHPHFDHRGGTSFFDKEATLIAHRNARSELLGEFFALGPRVDISLPTIFIEDKLELCFNEEDIQIIPTPGHTHSDLAVHFINSGVVCLGDLLFSDSFPFLDMARGGDIDTYTESLESLIGQLPEDITIIAGHGRDYQMDDLRTYHRMVIETTNLIKREIGQGKDADAMIDQEMLADWLKWSGPFVTTEVWIRQIFNGLTNQVKKSIAEPLTGTIETEGISAAIARYSELKAKHPNDYNFGEPELNILGYQLLWRDRLEEAIEVLKLNVEAFPQSANPYDSLGEAYRLYGDHALSIENYQKALALDPTLVSAKDALRKAAPPDGI